MVLELFDSVSSTMDVARERVTSGCLDFNGEQEFAYQGVMARQQTAGRGQRGRDWYDVPGESLCATYYFRREWVRPPTAGLVSLLTGVVVAETIQTLCLQTAQHGEVQARLAGKAEEENSRAKSDVQRIGLKWPNDVLLNGRKAGGILIEMTRSHGGDWIALVGVGLNVNQYHFPSELAASATSLWLEGITSCFVPLLGEQIADALDRAGRGELADVQADVVERWRTLDATTGRRFETEHEGRAVTGIATGMNDTGALCLHLDDGRDIAVLTASSLRPL